MEQVLSKLSGVQKNGPGFVALCPSHPDFTPSLSIDPGTGGRVLLRCRAGCPIEKVMQAAGLTWGDVMGDGLGLPPLSRRRAEVEVDHEFRHQVYSDFLGSLVCTADDQRSMEARGLSLQDVDFRTYRSLGFLSGRRAARGVFDRWKDKLFTVPGFLPGPRLVTQQGLVIPVRDLEGRITALQVRQGTKQRKYTWFSSSENSCGRPAHAPLGFPKNPARVTVTEGPLKADVVFALTGVPTLAVAGTNAWEAVLPWIESIPDVPVDIAFDQENNPATDHQRALFAARLRSMGREVKRLVWAEGHKGVDDAALAGSWFAKVDT